MKKKLLIVGIEMLAAGTEKACLSFISRLDRNKYDIELLLAKKDGAFLKCVPSDIRVSEMKNADSLFLLDKNNAVTVVKEYIKRYPSLALMLSLYAAELLFARGDKKTYIKNRIWLAMMKKLPRHEGRYDIAAAFWGDRTLFYTVDKVSAEKKVSWQHFEFGSPPRESALYGEYFGKCDAVVAVSEQVACSVKEGIPYLGAKVRVLENFTDAEYIAKAAEENAGDIKNDGSVKILSVGRLEYQKGFDIAINAAALVIKSGYPVTLYIIGRGSEEEKLKELSRDNGIESSVCFLGFRDNPYKYMKACDLYIQPSRYEGKPISVEEAKIVGIPVIACAYSSAEKQLDGYGTVCKTDAEALAKEITAFCADKSRHIKKTCLPDNEEYGRLIDGIFA